MPTEPFLDQVRVAAHDPNRALRLTLDHFRAATGTIHELGSDGVLHLTAWNDGIPDRLLLLIRDIPVGKGIAGLAVERKEPVDLCNLQTDESGTARPKARETGIKGSICVPMMDDDRAAGALGIGTVEEREFRADEIELLMAVGRLLAKKP
jgi:L-methionine (R)-S-oxide reductase